MTETASPYKAPRFHAEFQRLEGRSILLMRREEWERMKAHAEGEPISIDLAATPLKRLTTEAHLFASIAERRSDYEVAVTIYREDLADAPKGAPINVDRYTVWERIPDHRDLMRMVNTASTEDNTNMRGFLSDHVFMVKDPAGLDHWLAEVPAKVVAVVQHRENGPHF
jgi:hypothetical protein